MPDSQSLYRRVGVAARWPLGVMWTSWRYMWRTTPLHRREREGAAAAGDDCPPLPTGVRRDEIQSPADGVGPLFHRRYAVRIRDAQISPSELMRRVQADPDVASPREFARFRKTRGEDGQMRVGDEYVVRMAGPGDGPVRVIDAGETSFRLATLGGHLEAGQIEFNAADSKGRLEFRIESWARSAHRLVHLLYPPSAHGQGGPVSPGAHSPRRVRSPAASQMRSGAWDRIDRPTSSQ